ncbi:LytR/AlgR family response regulator transcription factor [Thalassomonas actiniarum]|uniref:Response regulator transcription factor n=1 Tax=Thalassomonas actiniarum TaxID=485447 RepID=A0AAF0C4S6_9GAMM|nr:LytTR family DNA-binding domain-containing protein [Thalassomonas actiniarum]WDE00299.1 response regulator transcription factor [Thalassomonas actiniarum]
MSCKSVIIVDDESAARHSLKKVIDTFSELKIVAEVADGKSAIEQIIASKPDIVFLDIEMPEVSGFDVAKATQNQHYQLVFLTAYEHYALQAFDTHAIDYLVKPARSELIAKCIRKILKQEEFVLRHQSLCTDKSRLVLSDYQQQTLLEYEHISYIESIGRYRRVHLTEAGRALHNTETVLSDMTLDWFCEQLPEEVFYRLHRSYIINSNRMLELLLKSRRHFVRLADSEVLIPVSRNFLSTLKALIKAD